MKEYRVYQLSVANRIRSGTWIEAADDSAAIAIANDHCEAGDAAVEVWQGPRLVARLDCPRDEG